MKKQYDVIIVGAGPMGIFTAYELILKAPNKSVLLIEQGHDIYHRYCPIKDKKIEIISASTMMIISGCKRPKRIMTTEF